MVGGVGFAVDTAALYLLARGAGLDLYSARVASYLIAASVTWWLNRHFTFETTARPSAGEWVKYVTLNAVGALVNYGIYAAAITWTATARAEPVIAVALGSAVAMVVNFLANRHLVFRNSA